MSTGVITMSKLGQLGRFGNQLFQYMFLKTYARRYNLQVQVPPWIGNYLFGASDPPIENRLPEFIELYDKDPNRMVIPRLAEPLKNVDFSGFFQYPTHYYVPDRDFIRSLFQPIADIRAGLDEAVQRLRQLGRTIVGVHLRRGDYGTAHFYITPTAWYVKWLETIWSHLDRPVLFVASDEPGKVLQELSSFRPITAADLGVELPKAPYYPDFYLLSRVDIMAMPNSTYSFAAAMLNENLQEAYRSYLAVPLPDPPFCRLDPWNATPLDCASHVAHFPSISGIAAPAKPASSGFRPLRWIKSLVAQR